MKGFIGPACGHNFKSKGWKKSENKHKDHIMLFAHNIEKIKTDLVKSMNSFLY